MRNLREWAGDYFQIKSNATTEAEYKQDLNRFYNNFNLLVLPLSLAIDLNIIVGTFLGAYPPPALISHATQIVEGFALGIPLLANSVAVAKESFVNRDVRRRLKVMRKQQQ